MKQSSFSLQDLFTVSEGIQVSISSPGVSIQVRRGISTEFLVQSMGMTLVKAPYRVNNPLFLFVFICLFYFLLLFSQVTQVLSLSR